VVGSRVFWKIVPGYAAVVGVTALVVGIGLGRRVERTTLAEIEARLSEGVAAAREVEAAAPPDLQESIRRMGRDTELRYTIIAGDGTVRADSEHDPATMENHADRPEVREATVSGTGKSTRRSATLGIPMMYVAQRVPHGTIRAAMPLRALDRRRAALRSTVALAVGLALVVGVALGLVVTRWFAAPLARMSAAARDIASGHFERRVEVDRQDEIGVLGRAVNLLAGEAQRRVESVTKDRDRLHTILSGMVEGVVAVDPDERVLLINDVAGRMIGADARTAAGRPLRNVTRVHEIADVLADTLRSGVTRSHEIRLAGPRGGRLVQTHAGTFGPGGHTLGAVVVLHDVTELRRLESVRRDFVANVSHELKTPLTAIRGMLETMLDDREMPEDVRRSFLERISAQANRLAQIVTDLLGLARVESRPEDLAKDQLDFRETVEETRRALEGAARDGGVSLACELPDEPVHVLGDRPSLRLLVDNLVDNAIKYTRPGGRVGVTLVSDGAWATLAVADTGIGIEPRHGDRIFERFYRVDPSRSRELGSTGLGLAIVRNVAQVHGGSVTYDSMPGRGTEFRVRLPVGSAPPPPAPPS